MRALETFRRSALVAVIGISVAAISVPAFAAVPVLEEIHIFEPDDGYRAGWDVALSGDYAIYTSRRDSQVEISHLSDGTWSTATLERPGGASTNSYFGAAVELNSDATTAFVAAPRDRKIYSWHRTGDNTWTVGPEYAAPTVDRVGNWSNTFAEVMAYSNGRLVVGAPNATVDGVSNAGAGLVFDVSGEATDGASQPLLGDPVSNQIMGQAVAIDQNTVVLGAPQYSSGGFRTGAAYIFDLDGDLTPTRIEPNSGPSICHPPSSGGGPAFGISVALSDGVLAVGSPEEKTRLDGTASTCTWPEINAGEVALGAMYLFTYDGTPGNEIFPVEGNYYFGQTVGLSNDLMMVGAVNGSNAGRLLVYDLGTLAGATQPVPVQELVPSDSAPDDGFGGNIYGQGPAISGDAALVGAPQKRSGAGSVFYFSPLRHGSSLAIADTQVEYRQSGNIVVQVENPDTTAQLIVEIDGLTQVVPVEDGVGVLAAPDLEAGTYPVVATYRLDADTVLATTDATHTVTKAPTQTTVATVKQAKVGQEISITGTLSASYGAVQGSQLTVTINGSALLPATTDDNGNFVATGTLPETAGSKWDVAASFAGDNNHLASSAETTVTESSITPTPDPTPTPVDPTSPTTQDKPTSQEKLSNTGASSLAVWGVIAGLAAGLGFLLRRFARSSSSN